MLAAGAGRGHDGSGGGGRGGGRGAGGGGGGGGRGGPLLDRDEFRVVSSFWPEYFPDEVMCGGAAGGLPYGRGGCEGLEEQ